MSYLTQAELETLTITATVECISMDTYNELLIKDKVAKLQVNELYACALQFSIVGCGNRNFGEVKIDDTNINCKKILDKNKILYHNQPNSALKPDDVSLKRLTRLFRFHIQKYIQETENYSFLYKKYCTIDCDPSYVFPGAEYLVDKENSDGLINSYTNLDLLLGTSFTPRIQSIIDTRNKLEKSS